MICRPCRDGADCITEAFTEPRTHYPKLARTLALQFHALCRGCDCQHKVDLQIKNATAPTSQPQTPPFADQEN